MVETWQVLLIVVVLVLTTLLTVIGIQIIYILKEFRRILNKTSNVVENASNLTKTFSSSVGSLAGFGAGLKAALSLVSFLKKKHANNERSTKQ